MEAHVITIVDNPRSFESAKRCIKSGQRVGIDVNMFRATTPKDPIYKMLEQRGIDHRRFDERYSRKENGISCFLSHMRLWEYCFKEKKEVLILEHDAVFQQGLPRFLNYKMCMTIGQPSYGQFNLPELIGVQPLTQKQYFKGAHAYCVKPKAAKHLIENAKIYAAPTDLYLNNSIFPWLEELYPWVCEVKDTFSTVQNRNGCLAKHKYNTQYEVIDV